MCSAIFPMVGKGLMSITSGDISEQEHFGRAMLTVILRRTLPSSDKHPWSVEIHGPKNESGHLHGEAICGYNAYNRIIKIGGGCFTQWCILTRENMVLESRQFDKTL